MDDHPGDPAASFGEACASMARVVAASRDLAQVIEPMAAAIRTVVPFDGMGVWHAEAPDDPVRLTLGPSRDIPSGGQPLRRSEHSPRLWPRAGEGAVVVGDATRDLNDAFRADRVVVRGGYRSVLVLPLDDDARQVLWLVHRELNTYTDAHARALGPVADLATLAIEHDQLRTLAHERRRKREALETLLPTLARALDVQVVFAQISAVVRDVLPHDYLTVGLVTADGAIRFHASTTGQAAQAPEYRPTTDFGIESLTWDFYLVFEYTTRPDGVVGVEYLDPRSRQAVTREFRPSAVLLQSYTVRGIRSELRIPVSLQGERVGYLFFTSKRTHAYSEDDVELARRVADHVALALAHERLAAEATRATQAQQQAAQLQERVDALVEELAGVTSHRALGRSRRWQDALAHATKVAETDTTVLITGESGTGKEVVARFIHRASNRAKRPFVALNCAALPEQLLESELFGYERGAFTGAHSARAGRLEQAAGGVLFLDEVGEMSPIVQAKFLRVLQEREFQRLGGTGTLRADVRVIAATNRDPRVAMERGTLREDLYYRLSVFEITLPPLRERAEDILLLAEAFLAEIGRTVGRPAAGVSKDARDRLLAHRWPGNVRELRNALERAVILCDGGLITGEHLPMSLATAPSGRAGAPPGATTVPTTIPPEGVKLEAIERDLIQRAMAQAQNNKSEAARLLGLGRGQLYSRLKRYGLTSARR